MSGMLDELRVLDLTSGRPGGIATMVLADFGAEVLKVEPPGGDPARAEAAWPLWMRGKHSLSLDLGLDTAGMEGAAGVDDAGGAGGAGAAAVAARARLAELVAAADVVVTSLAPAAAAAAGLDPAELRRRHPRLIVCSITGWGPRGPLAGYPADEALVAAKSGRMWAMANIARRDGPAFTAVEVATHAAAQSAVAGILAALEVRDRTGHGDVVETSLLQGMFPYDINGLVREQLGRRYPERFGNDLFTHFRSAQAMPTLGYQPIMGSDGRWLQLANLLEHLFQASLVALDLAGEVLANPRYAGAPALSPERTEEVRDLMLARARERTADEWMAAFRENGNVAADYVGTAQEALAQPDLVANGEVVTHQHPALGPVQQVGLLAQLSATPGRPGGPAPAPGVGGAALAGRWLAAPRPGAPSVEPPGATGAPRAPLAGLVVVEFATIIAAPLAAAFLADMGARVIKVEPVDGGDPMRGITGSGPLGYVGCSKTTAGKESICLDLKSEEGQAIVRRLVANADVLIHNYRPGVPERLGIGYEQVRAYRPEIVWVSASGYGPGGPSAQRPAAHPIPGAVDGGALMQAGGGWPGPVETLDQLREASRRFYRANEANPDPNTSMVIVSAALLGLRARRRTGAGQAVHVSMLAANAYANADDFLSYAGKPPRAELDAELLGTGPLRRLYRAAGGSWVCLSLPGEEAWPRFCALTGREELSADDRFATAAARAEHAPALIATLEALFAERHADAWEALLAPAGVGCVRADDHDSAGAFLLESEQIAANEFAPPARHAALGTYRRWGPVVTLRGAPAPTGGGTLAGEHTDTLLAELGYAPAEVADLRARGVTWSETPVLLEPPA